MIFGDGDCYGNGDDNGDGFLVMVMVMAMMGGL